MNTPQDYDGVKGYPSPLISNSEKGKSYILNYIKAAYQSWSTGGSGSFYADRSRKLGAQAYRLGQQDPATIQNLLNLKGEITEVNVNFSPLPIVQRFADLIVNNILNNRNKLKLEFSDNMSVKKKDKFRRSAQEKMAAKPMAELLTQVMGMDMTDKNVPQDEEDLELMMEVDYRDLDEIALLAFVKAAQNMNGFTETTREFVDDLVAFNEGVLYTRLDPKEGIVIEYVNDVNFIRSTSKEKSNKNIQHAGEIKTVTFSELRTMIQPEDGISDDELNLIAQGIAANTGGYGNVNWDDPIYADRLYGTSRWYDELSIDIVKMEFMDVNYDIYEQKQTKLGLPVIHKRPNSYSLPKESRYERSIFTDTYQTVLKGIWLRGTDYVIGAGRADNILLQGKDLSKARLNYSIYTIPGKSMVERMIPYADQMWIAHVKIQQLIAKLRPAGASINLSALEDALKISDGEYYQPIELMNLYDITGNVLYRDDTEEDGLPRRSVPINPMPNNIGSQLTELSNVYNQNLEIIRDMTNVSKFLDGSQVSSKTLVGVQEQGIEQSNMGIKHLSDAYEFLVTDSTTVCIMIIQDIFRYPGLTSAYEKAIGEFAMETVERFKNIPIEQLNVTVVYGMDDKEIMTLDNDINTSIAAKELRVEDGITIREIDDLRLANRMLIKRRKVYAQEMQKIEEDAHARMMEAKQADQEAEAAKIQAEAEAKSNGEILVINAQAEINKLQKAEDHKNLMEVTALENAGKLEVAQLSADGQKERFDKGEKAKDERIKDTKSMESSIASQKENNEGVQDFRTPKPMGQPTV